MAGMLGRISYGIPVAIAAAGFQPEVSQDDDQDRSLWQLPMDPRDFAGP